VAPVGGFSGQQGEHVIRGEFEDLGGVVPEGDGVARIERGEPVTEVVDAGVAAGGDIDAVGAGGVVQPRHGVVRAASAAVLVGGNDDDIGIGEVDADPAVAEAGGEVALADSAVEGFHSEIVEPGGTLRGSGGFVGDEETGGGGGGQRQRGG